MYSFWIIALAVVVPVTAIVLKTRRSSARRDIDGGSVSTSWIAEHRSSTSDDGYSR